MPSLVAASRTRRLLLLTMAAGQCAQNKFCSAGVWNLDLFSISSKLFLQGARDHSWASIAAVCGELIWELGHEVNVNVNKTEPVPFHSC
jgi:hypothetical protein